MININPEIKKIIEENPIALATTDKSNNPNVIAAAYVKVVSKNKILITDNFMKQTIENLNYNNNCCVAVWNSKWEGFKLLGHAKYFNQGKWKKYIEEMPENKGLPSKGAILIEVTNIKRLG